MLLTPRAWLTGGCPMNKKTIVQQHQNCIQNRSCGVFARLKRVDACRNTRARLGDERKIPRPAPRGRMRSWLSGS